MRRCRVCKDVTLYRDKNGSICSTCKRTEQDARAVAKAAGKPPKKLLPPRPRVVEAKVDTSKYVPGAPPSPFLLEQVYREARRATSGDRGDDIVSRQPFLRRVSAEFHRRLRELGVPMEGA